MYVCEELHFFCCTDNLDLLTKLWASRQAMKCDFRGAIGRFHCSGETQICFGLNVISENIIYLYWFTMSSGTKQFWELPSDIKGQGTSIA